MSRDLLLIIYPLNILLTKAAFSSHFSYFFQLFCLLPCFTVLFCPWCNLNTFLLVCRSYCLSSLVICRLGSVDYSCCLAGLGQQKLGRLRHKAFITVGPLWRPPSLILSSRWILIFFMLLHSFPQSLFLSASPNHKYLKMLLLLENSFKHRKNPLCSFG